MSWRRRRLGEGIDQRASMSSLNLNSLDNHIIIVVAVVVICQSQLSTLVVVRVKHFRFK